MTKAPDVIKRVKMQVCESVASYVGMISNVAFWIKDVYHIKSILFIYLLHLVIQINDRTRENERIVNSQ